MAQRRARESAGESAGESEAFDCGAAKPRVVYISRNDSATRRVVQEGGHRLYRIGSALLCADLLCSLCFALIRSDPTRFDLISSSLLLGGSAASTAA